MKLKPERVLEVGIGNGTVSNYLRNAGLNIKTCDINPNLKPGVVSDIRKLPFDEKSFDLVMACEILEHIPFEDFEKALSELYKVSRKYVLISIPYITFHLDFALKIPKLRKILKKDFVRLFLGFPLFFYKRKPFGGHFWEMGTKGYSKKRVMAILNKNFKILKEESPLLNSYHYFFLLEKKI
jgi:ubiquinone/menaquinone biosynthesis C-methylase UbiE